VQPLLQWKSDEYYTMRARMCVCVCSFRYLASKAHAPYFHLWPAPLYNIFPHFLIYCRIFEKKKLPNTKCVFWFSLHFRPKHYSFYEEMSEIWHKMYIGLHVRYRYSCPILIKLEFSRRIFEKSSNIKLHKNPSGGSRVVPYGRTDGQTDRCDKANSRFSQFCERA
jgi:hypothetical protein